MSIVVCHNINRKEYFFCTHHSGYGLGDDWVPVSFNLPMNVVPRPALPSGLITNLDEYRRIFLADDTEIPHPFPHLDKLDWRDFYPALCEISDYEKAARANGFTVRTFGTVQKIARHKTDGAYVVNENGWRYACEDANIPLHESTSV
jgi:hypothetical protein